MKYEFKPSGNKDFDKIIYQFDKQIKREYPLSKGNIKECPSFWQKTLFLETFNLDINDWRQIRVGDYWKRLGELEGIEKNKFIINKVRRLSLL
jgi:hypothetical protein